MPSLVEILDASRVSNVSVTPQATVLIKTIVDAIAEDPHPRWRSRDRRSAKPDLLDAQRVLTARLPEMLKAVQNEEGASERRVTTFDILHWLTIHLDSWCPFDK